MAEESKKALVARLVAIGDPHLRRTDPLGVVGPDGRNTRLKDKLSALKGIIDYSIANNATHIIFLGDIFDSINPPDWLKRLFWETVLPAYKKGIKIRIIIGNHDRTESDNYNFASDNVILPENILIIPHESMVENIPLSDRDQPFTIKYIPYKNKGEIEEDLKSPTDATFGHFEIAGAQLAPDNTKIRHGIDAKAVQSRLTWLGHIHKFQEFRPGFAFIGSTVKCDFGEVNNQKVFGKLDVFSNGQMKLQYNEIPQRPMYQYEIHEDDPDNLYISERIPKELTEEGILIKFIFVGSPQWIKSINKAKFTKRFKNAVRVVTSDRRLDVDRVDTGLEHSSTKMEDRVHMYVKEKKKGKEYLTSGLEIVKIAQELAEESENEA